jgi:hypothetical protein
MSAWEPDPQYTFSHREYPEAWDETPPPPDDFWDDLRDHWPDLIWEGVDWWTSSLPSSVPPLSHTAWLD